jgi:hypothetical protein
MDNFHKKEYRIQDTGYRILDAMQKSNSANLALIIGSTAKKLVG